MGDNGGGPPKPTFRQLAWLAIQGGAVIAGLIGLNELVYRAAFDTSYLSWYLANGALIQILSGLIWFVFDLDRDEFSDVIAAHPFRYLAGWVGFGAMYAGGLSGFAPLSLRVPYSPLTGSRVHTFSLRMERAIAIISVYAFLALLFTYLLVVVPVQYVSYLVAGAPARAFRASDTKTWLTHRNEDRSEVFEIRIVPRATPVPEGSVEAGFTAKPVSVTNGIAALLLLALSSLI